MERTLKLLLALPFLISIIFLTSCGSSEDQLSLRSNIAAMRAAITSHQPEKLMQYIDTTYKSPAHPNKKILNNFVSRHLNSNRIIHLYLADIDIELDGNIAKITFYSGVAGGPDQIPERGRLFKVGTHWLKTDGQWKITQAKWRPALLPRN